METYNERIAFIRNDREHGSRWLVRETISVLYDIARQPTSSQRKMRSNYDVPGMSWQMHGQQWQRWREQSDAFSMLQVD